MTKANDATGWYADVFKNWQASVAGPKPTNELLAQVHALGLRPGKQAMANAMYLRPGGATSPQVVFVCGAPQLNRMRGLRDAGDVRQVPTPPVGNHTVYRIELTAKGKAVIQKTTTAASKAADKAAAKGEGDTAPKAKRASKPRKPKVTTPTAPVTNEPAAEAPAQA